MNERQRHLYDTDPRYREAYGGDARPLLPCPDRGERAGDVACEACGPGVRLVTYQCRRWHQPATLARRAPGHLCCRECLRLRDHPHATTATYSLVAPLGVRESGAGDRGDWRGLPHYPPAWRHPYTVAVPHLDTPDHLAACLALLTRQEPRPYVLVIDTGSPPAVMRHLEETVRGPGVEVHYVRSHGYLHSSQPVTVAMDLAFSLCRTPILIATHADVFLRRRDACRWLADQVSEASPVVGWQMSPRDTDPSGDWRRCVSHTFTGFHMPTMRRCGINWSFERYYQSRGLPGGPTVGWPDTESTLLAALDAAGIVPVLLGEEPNFQRHQTEWYDHARSVAGVLAAHGPADPLRLQVEGYAAQALADARARAAEWRDEVIAGPIAAGRGA